MSTPILLVLALIQAPAPPGNISAGVLGGDFQPLVAATEPVLAPRAAAPAVMQAIRVSSTDAWGCAYGSSSYCRHESAVTVEGSGLPFPPMLDPCPWTGQCVGFYPSSASFNAGQFVAWQWRWGAAVEFEQTNRGLADGKAIMEARAREAAARQGSQAAQHSVSIAPRLGGGGYSPPAQSYAAPASAGSVGGAAATGGGGRGKDLP